MNLLIIEFQAFKNNHEEFIVKELAVGDLSGWVKRFLFKPPFAEADLHPRIQTSNRWCSRNLHGFQWEDGDLPYSNLSGILFNVSQTYKCIATKGHNKIKFLSNILKREVFDLDEIMKFRIYLLPPTHVRCGHRGACALDNVIKIQNWFKQIILLLNFKCNDSAQADEEMSEEASEFEGFDEVG